MLQSNFQQQGKHEPTHPPLYIVMRAYHKGPPATKDAPLLQLCVQSLEGALFYTSPENSTGSWQVMEYEFLQ